jgi:hypothetical protein
MKKILILAVSFALTLTATAQQIIDLSSVDKFFEIAEKIQSNQDVSEDDWKDLRRTSGYRGRFAPYEIIPEMLLVAFSNNQQSKRDSILNLPTEIIMQDWHAELTQETLLNFLDMKKNQKELKLFRETYDFDGIKNRSIDRLKSFLIYHVVDTLFVFPSISLLCQEPNWQYNIIGGVQSIIMDFNLFFKQTEEERVNVLAHEMFHMYRDNYRTEIVKINKINYPYFFRELSKLQNEGIADLIDKKGLECHIDEDDSQELIDLIVSTYNNTPQILNNLDIIVNSYINKEISEEQLNEKMNRFFFYGGRINGLYMIELIRDAGLFDEMLKTFYSPVEFLKLYNKAAKKKNIYVLSDVFMRFAGNLEKSIQ